MANSHSPGPEGPDALDPISDLSLPPTDAPDTIAKPEEPAAAQEASSEAPSPAPAAVVAASEPSEPPLPASFAELGELPEWLTAALVRLSWDVPTPVQALTFHAVSAGRDVLVRSQTGSGKTGAFCVPWLANRFEAKPARETGVQMLVLVPTRELAKQVASVLSDLSQHSDVVVLQIYGGTAMQPQLSALKAGVHAVVGTPGRVLDHIRRRSLDLSRVRMVVLDEADEMLSMGFLEDIHAILDACNKTDRQTTLFSATVPSDVERIARRYMRQPETIRLRGDQASAEEIRHAYYTVAGAMKIRDLLDVIDLEEPATGLIFCNTREETNMVAAALRREGHRAEPLSSDLTQAARERVMGRMREGKLRFLVATDVASRGIDIDHISHVINYSFPENAESYIHRTGRTGRAGRAGLAISLIAPQELGNHYYLKLQYPSLKFEERSLPPAEELQKQRIETKLDQVSHMFPELVSPEWTLLARNLMSDPRGERVIAYLLSEGIPARTAQRAEAEGTDDADLEYRRPRESRGRGFEREGPRDRERGWDRGDRGRDRGRRWDRERDPDAASPAPSDAVSVEPGPEAEPARDAEGWDRGGDRERRRRRGRDRDRDGDRGRELHGRDRDRDRDRGEPRPAEPAARTETAPTPEPSQQRFGAEPFATEPDLAPLEDAVEADAAPSSGHAHEADAHGDPGRRRRRRRGRRRGGGREGDERLAEGEAPRDRASGLEDADGPTTGDATVSDAWVETSAEGEPISSGDEDDAGDDTSDSVSADALVPSADIVTDPDSLTSSGGRRRRRRRRRRGGGAPSEAAQGAGATGEADDEDEDGDAEGTERTAAGASPQSKAEGEGGRRRRRRRGRRRGKDRDDREQDRDRDRGRDRDRDREAAPPPQHVSQDEIVIDIDENELEVVRDEFGEIDELDELTLKGRRRGVMDALEEEVELEDMSGRDAPPAEPATSAQSTEAAQDLGDDDEGDEDDEPGAESRASDEDDEDAQKRRRRRRRRRKKKEPPPPPELTAPPHKDFWEVWAAKFSYTDFEDTPFFAHNDIPPEPEEPEEPEPRPAPRGERRRTPAPLAPVIDFSEPEEAEWVTVRLNVGRKHGKKAAHVRELFAEHYGLGGRAIRNLTVGEASTKLRMGAQAYGRAMEREGAPEVDGVELQLTLLEGAAAEADEDLPSSAPRAAQPASAARVEPEPEPATAGSTHEPSEHADAEGHPALAASASADEPDAAAT
jgi:superfamily II DNA/RNA helicase